jgi:hypothetical protein
MNEKDAMDSGRKTKKQALDDLIKKSIDEVNAYR